MSQADRIRRAVTTVLVLGLVFGLFWIPAGIALWAMNDPALGSPAVPRAAWMWHRSLSRRMEPWARARVASGSAARAQESVSGTEWPLFGTVFYLLATEELEKEAKVPSERPSVYARGAIEAAGDLVADPVQGTWVKAKWGDGYLHKENVFYRYLLIFGLSSFERLTGDARHHALLVDQVETLARELQEAPRFLLDDYPGECWPSDCVWAVAAIRRADDALGTNHSALVTHAVLQLKGPLLGTSGLPPYMADKNTAQPIGSPRGCSCSSILVFTPELSPELARQWYLGYEQGYWQRAGLFDGFREYPRNTGVEWGMDVDAGPIIMGHGVSACCFGIAAARANGRFDHARALAGEAIAWSWPLPNGSLMVPQVLSNQVDAPLLGESGMLFCLTRRPAPGMEVAPAGHHAPQPFLLVGLQVLAGLLLVFGELRRRRGFRGAASYARSKRAFVVWALLVLAAIVLAVLGRGLPAVGLLLLAISIPDRIAGRAPLPKAPPIPSSEVPSYKEPESWS